MPKNLSYFYLDYLLVLNLAGKMNFSRINDRVGKQKTHPKKPKKAHLKKPTQKNPP